MILRDMRALVAAAVILGAFSSMAGAADASDAALKAAIADKSRSAANAPRDVFRHPYETLIFWGLKPRMNVVEIEPGGAYWTEILAPYAKATGGEYAGTLPDVSGPKFPDAARKYVAEFKARFAA